MKWYYLFHPRPAFVVGSGVPPSDGNFMTASWVTPVSTEPPTVGVAVEKDGCTQKLIEKYGHFTVSVVEDPELLWYLGTVSCEEENKLERVGWRKGEKVPSPVPEGAAGWAECEVLKSLDVGDVVFYVGKVVNWKAERPFGRWGWDLRQVKVPMQKAGKVFLLPPCEEYVVKGKYKKE
ncbi:flavin reductase family protein [Ignicoccus hospitalis]|uniref:Flavin reductase domain protein, FMN-binding protein n=1 Tax=Ignicoccus hospitalis (strain KIN4/I / DSM 18386 / JCM 14125) TaxID=453591 RepID=A8ABV9_IGNH4|nr:flavin reductase family protein [Ignicoccus hospitalis]ABU82411.1 flavin reductase domain protein, FMN-binding protein [Ignicoccus hospitalis KIN4/I]HIH90886.1 flavin reductase family protein [Desulfurococcaceae archaeon]